MTEEGILRKKLDWLNQNSHYGIMTDNDMFDHISIIMNVDQAEIAKIVHDYIERGISCDYDRLNCPKPPIYIGPVKVKTLKERLEDNKMKKATSVQKIENVKDICFDISHDPIERESKLTIVASTNDDIFAFEFEGQDICQSCKAAGLFAGWEKDQKIRELEKELRECKNAAFACEKARDEVRREKNKEINNLKQQLQQAEIDKRRYEEKIKNLEHADMLDKEAADYWSKEHDTLSERFAKLQEENKKLKDKVEHVEPFRALEQTIREKHELKKELALEKAANEAQRKFIQSYAGKGTEVQFNYAIDETREVSYVIVDKEEYNKNFEKWANAQVEQDCHKNSSDNVNHPSHYTGRYECIDVMQDVFGDEATNDFCLCNAFKYIWRARKKNGIEDVKKAVWYLNKYIEEAEKDGEDKVTRTRTRLG